MIGREVLDELLARHEHVQALLADIEWWRWQRVIGSATEHIIAWDIMCLLLELAQDELDMIHSTLDKHGCAA